jgi:hypothetical protein
VVLSEEVNALCSTVAVTVCVGGVVVSVPVGLVQPDTINNDTSNKEIKKAFFIVLIPLKENVANA